MTNKYNFEDTGIEHILYQEEMEQFNLSFSALKTFAMAIKDGDLAQIKTMFQELSTLQKKGLLAIKLDYAVLENPFEWGSPRASASELANHFNHKEIETYLLNANSSSIFQFNMTLFSHSDMTILFEEEAIKDVPHQGLKAW